MAEIIISFSYQHLLPLLHLHQIYRSPSRSPLLCKPSSCRGLLIQYPFCLKGDPAKCGDPNYQLTCCSNRILMEFLSDQFSVNKINYADSMMDAIEVGLLRNSLQCSHQIIACNFCFYFQILSVKILVLDLLNDLFKKADYKGALVNSLFELERFICLWCLWLFSIRSGNFLQPSVYDACN